MLQRCEAENASTIPLSIALQCEILGSKVNSRNEKFPITALKECNKTENIPQSK